MTTSTSLQTSPYLRQQFQFPDEDVKTLANQVDHIYVDIAQKVNNRTIGLHAKGFSCINGESWYLSGSSQRQQALRQIYTFTGTGSLLHGIDVLAISQFTKCMGSFKSGNNYYGAIYGSNIAIAGQVSFYITSNSAPGTLDGTIVILAGAGAPAITNGIIILEWMALF